MVLPWNIPNHACSGHHAAILPTFCGVFTVEDLGNQSEAKVELSAYSLTLNYVAFSIFNQF
jgi:hypothetical protein